MSNKSGVRSVKALRGAAGACLALLLASGLTGCGPENAAPVAAPSTGTPGGVSQDDYAKHMSDQKPGGATGGSTGTSGPGSAPASPPGPGGR